MVEKRKIVIYVIRIGREILRLSSDVGDPDYEGLLDLVHPS